MKRAAVPVLLCAVAALLAGTSAAASATTAPAREGAAPAGPAITAAVPDDRPDPAADKQRALRVKALQDVIAGRAQVETINGVDVVKTGTKPATPPAGAAGAKAGAQRSRSVAQYVQLSREKTDKIFVLLTEFGDARHPRFPDQDTNPQVPGPTTFSGPRHNQIPEPDRATDNYTVWQPDYSPDHYRQLYFGSGKGVESLKTYYQRQSSGRYSVTGMVTDWTRVRYNEARYGRSSDDPADGDDPAVCPDRFCDNSWYLVRDGLNQWVADQKAAGKTDAQIKAIVSAYDQEDRYDVDGDGNFREPDGYLDHFQMVHAGGDESDGDPHQGEDAIWAHKWYAFYGTTTGPAGNQQGGVQIGNTGIWAGDYTVQPENGGLSIFAHEYGHDLGLPDHYDTSQFRDNAVNWWTLMAQSRARAAGDVGVGTRPADLGVWDKLQLGWLDYETAVAGQSRTYELGPHEYNTDDAQALAVVLPQKKVEVDVPDPAGGSRQWWSGSGDKLTATLERQVEVPSAAARLSFRTSYDMEVGFDAAVLEVGDGAGGWTVVPTSLSTASSAIPGGIDGSTDGEVVTGTADLSAYAGRTVTLRFRYTTDGAIRGNDAEQGNDGLFLDDIALGSFTDDVESGPNGWQAAGFTVVGEAATLSYDNYYLASYRANTSYDRYLRTGPYNFGFEPALWNKVEFFPYQNGLLVNYWDASYTDNNQSDHPGHGLVLPIDSHPRPLYGLDGRPWRGAIQTYDAPFSLTKPDSFTLHQQGRPCYVRGQGAQPLFDDTRSYWDPALPFVGVKTPAVGVTLEVVRQDDTTMTVRLGTSSGGSSRAGSG